MIELFPHECTLYKPKKPALRELYKPDCCKLGKVLSDIDTAVTKLNDAIIINASESINDFALRLHTTFFSLPVALLERFCEKIRGGCPACALLQGLYCINKYLGAKQKRGCPPKTILSRYADTMIRMPEDDMTVFNALDGVISKGKKILKFVESLNPKFDCDDILRDIDFFTLMRTPVKNMSATLAMVNPQWMRWAKRGVLNYAECSGHLYLCILADIDEIWHQHIPLEKGELLLLGMLFMEARRFIANTMADMETYCKLMSRTTTFLKPIDGFQDNIAIAVYKLTNTGREEIYKRIGYPPAFYNDRNDSSLNQSEQNNHKDKATIQQLMEELNALIMKGNVSKMPITKNFIIPELKKCGIKPNQDKGPNGAFLYPRVASMQVLKKKAMRTGRI